MKLRVNREFLLRHLFVALLMVAMGGWFGYDGFVRYPSMTARELYADAHKGAEPATMEEAVKFQQNAIPRQKQFMAICWLAAAAIGFHLLMVARLKFEFGEAGFSWGAADFAWGDVLDVDEKAWAKKGIVRVKVAKGWVTLDAWHHIGVEDFKKKLDETKSRNGGMADTADLKSAGR